MEIQFLQMCLQLAVVFELISLLVNSLWIPCLCSSKLDPFSVGIYTYA